MKRIEIAIPVIVGSNGKWCANGFDSVKDPAKDADWGFMADSLDSSGPNDREPVWPSAERRYIIRAFVEVPDEFAAEIVATSVEDVS